MLCVTERDGERIGRVRAEPPLHAEQRLDHVLDLRLLGAAVARDRLLDRAWRVFVHGHSRRRDGGERDAAGDAATEFCGMRRDAASGAVYLRGAAMSLPPRELALLRALLARPGHAVARERLLDVVFPDQAQVQAEAIEVVAYRLRKKIAGTGAQLVTLRGLGYLLKAAP